MPGIYGGGGPVGISGFFNRLNSFARIPGDPSNGALITYERVNPKNNGVDARYQMGALALVASAYLGPVSSTFGVAPSRQTAVTVSYKFGKLTTALGYLVAKDALGPPDKSTTPPTFQNNSNKSVVATAVYESGAFTAAGVLVP